MREFGTDKGREGVQNPEDLEDVICTCPLRYLEEDPLCRVAGLDEFEDGEAELLAPHQGPLVGEGGAGHAHGVDLVLAPAQALGALLSHLENIELVWALTALAA